MKRWMSILCGVCAVALLLTAVGFAEGYEEIAWNAYCLEENATGGLVQRTPPETEYTDRGLQVTAAGTSSYTLQTLDKYAAGEDLYLELTVDAPSATGVLVFHLWNRQGMLFSDSRSGSGWYGMISMQQNGTSLLVSANVGEVSIENPEGDVSVLGSHSFTALVNREGGLVYSLAVRDGVLLVNDEPVDESPKILAHLEAVAEEGFYLGVSMLSADADALSPVTLTRCGPRRETAPIPGSGGVIPETVPPETEIPDTDAPETEIPDTDAPETEIPDTDAPETEIPDTDAPETDSPETEAPGASESDPSESATAPSETETAPNDADSPAATEEGTAEVDPPEAGPAVTEAPEANRPSPDTPETGPAVTEPHTEEKEPFEMYQSFMEGAGCGSSVGAGAVVLAMASAAVLWLKKRD